MWDDGPFFDADGKYLYGNVKLDMPDYTTFKSIHVSGGTRTHSLRIRSPARYPLRHGDYKATQCLNLMV